VPALDKSEGETEAYYRIGVGSERTKVEQLPIGEAWRASLAENRENSLMLGELLQKARERESFHQSRSPARSALARPAGDAVEEGLQEKNWFRLVRLVTMISLNLGIFNLLPIRSWMAA